MKKVLVLFGLTIALFSCKNEPKIDPNAIDIEAEFIHIDNAAVLKGKTFIYGVILDDKAKELSDKVAPMKKEKYDMVPVKIKGVITDNPNEDGWDQLVKVEQIVEVLPVVKEEVPVDNQIKINVTQ